MTAIGWLALDMSIVLTVWAVVGFALVGIGVLVRRAARLPAIVCSPDARDVLDSFWLGLAATVALLQVWQLFLRVSPLALGVVLALGACGLLAGGAKLRAAVRACRLGRPAVLVCFAAMAVWLANRALGPAESFDDGLYHIQVVKWFGAYPLVPGLANLQVRYGFNNPTFLFTAALDVPGISGRGTHFANGLILLGLVVECVLGASLWLGSRAVDADGTQAGRPARARWAFLMIAIVPAVFFAVNKEVSGAGTDLPQAVLALVAAARLLEFLLRPRGDAGAGPARDAEAFVLTVMVALLGCVKLSGAFLAVGCCAVTWGVWLTRDRRHPSRAPEGADGRAPRAGPGPGRGLAAAALLLVPWMVRSVVLSGYPLFPATAFPMPVDWRAPAAAADLQRYDIRTFARSSLPAFVGTLARNPGAPRLPAWLIPPDDPAQMAEGARWVVPWTVAMGIAFPTETIVPSLIGLAAAASLLARRLRGAPETVGRAGWLIGVGVGAVAFWVAMAPEPRFGLAPCWVLGGALGALAVAPPSARPGSGAAAARRLAFGVVLALAAAALAHRVLSLKLRFPQRSPWASVPFVHPGPDRGFHPIPEWPRHVERTRSGLDVYVPTKGEYQIADAPLPATAEPNPDLALRVPGDLSAGFKIVPPK